MPGLGTGMSKEDQDEFFTVIMYTFIIILSLMILFKLIFG